MYLSRTVFIFVKSKKVWAKQGRKFFPFTSTTWSPPQFSPLHRHQELHTCHTRKHTRMYTKSSNAQLTLSERQSSKLVSKQTKPQLTAVTKKTDANMDFCSQWMSSPLISRAARHSMSFVTDANYAYQFIPTSTQYFTKASGCRKKCCVQNLGN